MYPTLNNLGAWGVFLNEVGGSKLCTYLKRTLISNLSDMWFGADL